MKVSYSVLINVLLINFLLLSCREKEKEEVVPGPVINLFVLNKTSTGTQLVPYLGSQDVKCSGNILTSIKPVLTASSKIKSFKIYSIVDGEEKLDSTRESFSSPNFENTLLYNFAIPESAKKNFNVKFVLEDEAGKTTSSTFFAKVYSKDILPPSSSTYRLYAVPSEGKDNSFNLLEGKYGDPSQPSISKDLILKDINGFYASDSSKTLFVRNSGVIDYPNVSACDAYSEFRGSKPINSVDGGLYQDEVFVFKLRGVEKYAILKINSIVDNPEEQDDYIEFEYKIVE